METQQEGEEQREERSTETEGKDTETEIQMASKQEPKENFERGLVSLVRAFENDPFFNYLNRNPVYRDKLIYHFFRCFFVARYATISAHPPSLWDRNLSPVTPVGLYRKFSHSLGRT